MREQGPKALKQCLTRPGEEPKVATSRDIKIFRGVLFQDAGWSSPVARQAHNLKVVSSNLAPATNFFLHHYLIFRFENAFQSNPFAVLYDGQRCAITL